MNKILFIASEYPPFKGGVGRFLHQLVSHIPKKNRVVVAPKQNQLKYETGVIGEMYAYKYIWPSWLPLVFKINRLVRADDISHIVVSSVLPLGAAALVSKIFTKKPYSVIVHGLDIAQHQHNFYKKTLIKLVLRYAKKIISISSYSTQLLQSYLLQSTKIHLVYPTAFCSPDNIQSIPIELLREKVSEKHVFLSVGRLTPRKNNKTILRVAESFLNQKNVVFVIAGDGQEKDVLKAIVKERGLSQKVFFTDKISDAELAWLYKLAYGVVFIPTSNEATGDVEGFGIVGVEAASFGIPVIASNQGGVPDAVQDSVSGILVPPLEVAVIKQAIDFLLTNPQKRNEMSKNARNFFQKERSPEKQKKHLDLCLGFFEKNDISIIIPAFNAAQTIDMCLQSIFKQTHQPLEIIVVDDGSTDNTLLQLRKYSDRIQLIKQPNSGAPSARNAGARVAKGTYLLFLDSDISMRVDMLETMKQALLLNPEISYAYSSFYFGWKKFASFPYHTAKLRSHNYIHTSSLLRAKDFLGFDESLLRHQDWDLWLTLAEKGKIGIHINEYLYKIVPQEKKISFWIPSFMYSFPILKNLKNVKKYEESRFIILHKHGIN